MKKKASKNPGVEPEDKPKPPQAKPKGYRIDKIAGGFALRPGKPGSTRPAAVFIPVAYDARGHNAINGYTVDDFELGKEPIRIDPRRGVKVTLGPATNEMLVQITEDDFELVVDGFGTTRDVITDPKAIHTPTPAVEPIDVAAGTLDEAEVPDGNQA